MADEDGNLSADQMAKLAQFQDITRIDSFDECKQLLEAFEWNIESALQHALSDHLIDGNGGRESPSSSTTSLASTSIPHSSPQSRNHVQDNIATSAAATSASFSPSSSDPFSTSATTPAVRPTAPPPPSASSSSAAAAAAAAAAYNNNYSRASSPNSNRQLQHLPSLSMLQQRTISYYAPRAPALPNGIIQWGVFIVAFPFRFLCSSLYDLFLFFYSFFESTTPIPIDYDPLANIAEFAFDFNTRHGLNHPQFYEGSYAQAVAEAKRDLKFLLIYLHQNESSDCALFAERTLSDRDLIEFINGSGRMLFWACTKNLPEGQKVHNALKAKRCPFLGVIVQRNARMSLVLRIEGPVSAGELRRILQDLINENEAELVAARHEREMLQENQLLRQQQDQAYVESLRADKEKAQRKKEEEERKRRAEEEAKQRLEEEKQRANNIVNRRKELREQLAEREVKMTDAATAASAYKICLKFPNGNRYERLFLKTDPLSDLYKFAFSHDECPNSFEIHKNFPRTVIECGEETTTSLNAAGIGQSTLLFICDLDA